MSGMFEHGADTAVAPHSALVCYAAYVHTARPSDASAAGGGRVLLCT
jgi:hypothetical protein